MALKLGIIGCQSKHAEFFGELFNRDKLFEGCRVHYISPVDEPERLSYVLSLTDIPTVVEDCDELIKNSDAVLITTRRAETHFEYVMKCIACKKPVFADKPFALDSSEASAMVEDAQKSGVPLVAGSTLCFLPEVEALRKKLSSCETAEFRYKADPDSEFGGYNFYGSHMTDLCSLFFDKARFVFSQRDGGAVVSSVSYDARKVTIKTNIDCESPEIVYRGKDGTGLTRLNDSACYRCGMQAFINAISVGGSMPNATRLIESTRLLAAINRSLKSGKEEAV